MLEIVVSVFVCHFAGWMNDGSFQERCSRPKEVTFTLDVESATTPYACMSAGQTEFIKWAEVHPDNWRIARMDCRPAGSVAKL